MCICYGSGVKTDISETIFQKTFVQKQKTENSGKNMALYFNSEELESYRDL